MMFTKNVTNIAVQRKVSVMLSKHFIWNTTDRTSLQVCIVAGNKRSSDLETYVYVNRNLTTEEVIIYFRAALPLVKYTTKVPAGSPDSFALMD